jgi:hypothetical protein
MPRGRPKQNRQAVQANGEAISKMEAVRRALAELGKDAKPLQMKEYIESHLGVEMSTDHISTYKSTLLKAGAGKKKPGRKPKIAPLAARTTGKGSIDMQDIRAVKELADRIGADNVRQLVDVLS